MAVAIEFARAVKNVMFAGHEEDLANLQSLENLLGRVEFFRLGELRDVAGVPMGTVMSSLSRARQRLREQLGTTERKEA